MPVFPPYFADLCEVRVDQTLPGNTEAVSVLFVERADVESFTDEATEIAERIRTFYATLAPALSDQWAVDQIRVIDRSAAGGSEYIVFDPLVSGALNVGALPTQTTVCVTWRTLQAGRRYRGRTNISGWTEDSCDADGDLNSSAQELVFDAGNTLISTLVGLGHSLVVLSRGNTSPPAPAAWAAFHTPVTSCYVDREFDVLRSRRK